MANLTGTGPNQVPTNGMLGSMAYQDAKHFESVALSYGGASGSLTVTSIALAGATKIFNTHPENYNSSTGEFTVPRQGLYSVTAKFRTASFAPSAVTGTLNIFVYVNGSEVDRQVFTVNSTTNNTYGVQYAGIIPLLKNDVIKILVNSLSGTVALGTSTDNRFSIARLVGA